MALHLSPIINHLISFFRGLIDLVYPPLCLLCRKTLNKTGICTECAEGFSKICSPLCSVCGVPFKSKVDTDHPCGLCIKKSPPFDIAASLFTYSGNIKDVISSFKYNGTTALAQPLASMMAEHELALRSYDLVIPVPLHVKKLRARGHNQSFLLAKELSALCGHKCNPWLLERIRETKPQTGMKRKERIANIKGAFAVKKDVHINGLKLLLIDDVYTTGATVWECAKELRKNGAAHISVLTLARTTAA